LKQTEWQGPCTWPWADRRVHLRRGSRASNRPRGRRGHSA
jgi:hypothetical protein